MDADVFGCLFVFFVLVTVVPIERKKRFTGFIRLAVRAGNESAPDAADLHRTFRLRKIPFAGIIADFTAFA